MRSCKLDCIHPGVFVPGTPAAYPVYERGVGLPCGRKGDVRHAVAVKVDVELVAGVRKVPSHHAFGEAVIIADVLKPLDADVLDNDVVRHELRLDEHLVAPSWRQANCRAVDGVKPAFQVGVIDVAVPLRHRDFVADLERRIPYKVVALVVMFVVPVF